MHPSADAYDRASTGLALACILAAMVTAVWVAVGC